MTPDQAIYDFIKDNYENVYFNKLPQSVKLNEATPKILIVNVSETKLDDKDKKGRYEVIYRVEVFGTNYMNAKETAYLIRTELLPYTDENIYLVTFDAENYETNDQAEVFRIITDYRVFINYDTAS